MTQTDNDALVRARYLSDRFEWAAPGDQQEDVWLLRFCDNDVRDAMWTGPDAEAEAWEAWNRHAPGYNCYLFRLAALRTPQPDETETLRAEVASNGAVFTIRVELEYGVSGANSTQIHTSVHTKAGANANPMIVMDAAMKALAHENAALHQCPAHKAALKGTDHGRG